MEFHMYIFCYEWLRSHSRYLFLKIPIASVAVVSSAAERVSTSNHPVETPPMHKEVRSPSPVLPSSGTAQSYCEQEKSATHRRMQDF
ncbi:hypothetical protein OXV66_09275 [Bacteroides fragilis]|nr:hypothetical protein [Bacteroides fragilis]